MGIFKDITKEEASIENQYKLRAETMEMAQKVIDKQMVAAQQIASLLGETTAETKATLTKLKKYDRVRRGLSASDAEFML